MVGRAFVVVALTACLSAGLGCELIVGDDTRYVEGDGGAAEDASTHPADADPSHADAAAPIDAAPAADASCGAECATTASSCIAACMSTEATCNAQCSNPGCQHQCAATEPQCETACANACQSCAANDHCAMPRPCPMP